MSLMATSAWWELSSEGQGISDRGDSARPSFDDDLDLPEGCSLIVEDSEPDEPEVERLPRRRIVSRSFRRASALKASSLLDQESTKVGAGKQSSNGDEFSSPNSMFQTAAGNTVSLSLAAIERAKALLGVHDNNDDHCTLQDYDPAKKKLIGNSRSACEQPEIYCSTKTPPIKFHTAGGRSISVSSEALHRARNLLGNPDMSEFLNEGDSGALMFSFSKNNDSRRNTFDKQHNTDSSLSHCRFEMTQQSPQKFVSPLCSSLKRKQSGAKLMTMGSRTNLISKFDAEARICKSNVKPSGMTINPSQFNDLHMKGTLADLTNTVGTDSANKKGTAFNLKRVGTRPSVSPFKMPRSSKFVTPLKYRLASDPTGSLGRGACPPLAFGCIKSNGVPIPRTLVGVTRVYPLLYREQLKGGRFVVRSEKMEASVIQLFNQRRSNIVEGIMSDFESGGNDSYIADDQDKEEGARIWKMLESVAEPEYLMADMTFEELKTLSNYQEKLLARKQSDMQRMIEKAVEDAGLHARDVTPFIQVRVVGLTNKDQTRGKDPIEGIIRIWNPTEKQKLELAEGKAYTISGLVPFHSDSNTLHLEARGSSARWEPLSKTEMESFMPFFNPRKPVSLSIISEVPLSSEFDTVGLVVHVGLEYISGQQKKQWAFVADGSLCQSQNEESISILAISFSSPSTEDDSISLLNYNIVGSVVGFCNLVKRAKDHTNQMWVADASENVAYCLNYDNPLSSSCNFKYAFASVQRWQQNSSMMINRLREKIINIIGCSSGSPAKMPC